MNVKQVLSLEPKGVVSDLRGEVVDLREPEVYGSRGDKKAWGLLKDAEGDKVAFVHWKCPPVLPYRKGDMIEITSVMKDGRPQGATYDPHNGKPKVSAWPGSIKTVTFREVAQVSGQGKQDPGWVASGSGTAAPPVQARAVPAREAFACLGRTFDHLLVILGSSEAVNDYGKVELAWKAAVELTRDFLGGRMGMPEAAPQGEDDEPPPFSILLPLLLPLLYLAAGGWA